MSQDPWDARVVASMVKSKRLGLTFDHAWAAATREHRPRAREVNTPTLDSGQLFGDDGGVEESLVDALYRFCWQAWHGERPKLRYFTLDALRAEPGEQIHDWRDQHRVAA